MILVLLFFRVPQAAHGIGKVEDVRAPPLEKTNAELDQVPKQTPQTPRNVVEMLTASSAKKSAKPRKPVIEKSVKSPTTNGATVKGQKNVGGERKEAETMQKDKKETKKSRRTNITPEVRT